MDPRRDLLGLWETTVGAARTITDAAVEGWTAAAPPGTPKEPEAASRDTGLEGKLGTLLARALEQSTTSAREELFHRILDQIVPDEARILSALSDGSSSPLISVHALNRAGLLGEALIENASLVGRTANVALPSVTPTYVGHLLALGLLALGDEDVTLKDEYQILLADSDVLRAIRQGSIGPVPARVEKRTVRLSRLGNELWAAANGSGA